MDETIKKKLFCLLIFLVVLVLIGFSIYTFVFIFSTDGVDNYMLRQSQEPIVWDGNSHRLGNLLDAWYFGILLGSKERANEFYKIANESSTRGNIGSFLHSLIITNNTQQYVTIPESDERRLVLQEVSDNYWASYHYKNLQLAQPEIRNDFQKVLQDYLKFYPSVKNCLIFKGGLKHCVIHYRLGDFITLGNSISIESLVVGCRSLPVEPTVFEILQGGKDWGGNPEVSEKVLQGLHNQLVMNFPAAEVIFSPELSVDEDFLKIVYAPLLVTSGGSFAILGALASSASSIRTVDCATDLHDCVFSEEETNLHGIFPHTDWKFYAFEKLKVDSL